MKLIEFLTPWRTGCGTTFTNIPDYSIKKITEVTCFADFGSSTMGFMGNWIERDALRKGILENGAAKLWQDIHQAIEDVCNSFNHHHSDKGRARVTVINGHRLLVEITHKQFELSPMAEALKRRVNIGFDDDRGNFSVVISIDEHPAQVIPMDADQNHCFLKPPNVNREVGPDELAEWALKDALFTPRNPSVPQSPAPKLGRWS